MFRDIEYTKGIMATRGASYVKSGGVHCSVYGCSYNQKKLNNILSQQCFDHKPLTRAECPCKPPYRLHRMPKNADLRREWLAALNRKDPPKNVFVCSYHFVDREPTEENPVPSLQLGYPIKNVQKRRVLVRFRPEERPSTVVDPCTGGSRKRKSSSKADTPPAKQLHQDTVESSDIKSEEIDVPCSSSSALATETPDPVLCTTDTVESSDIKSEEIDVPCALSSVLATKTPDPVLCTTGTDSTSSVNASTQWVDPHAEGHDYCKTWLQQEKYIQAAKKAAKEAAQEASKKETKDTGTQCRILEENGQAEILIRSEKDAKLYTGISLLGYTKLVACLSAQVKSNFRMPLADQILMTLMKLKLNLLYADLARRFSVSESLVSKTVSYWIDIMAKHLSQLIAWLPREAIRATLPECFKEKYPRTTCIIDCAETIMQTASNLKSRGESYSHYKSHNTVKYCVAIAPCGLIMHISRAYGGHASDKFIVEDSGLLERLVPGDEVMAYRGFAIRDLLFSRHVSLNIPPFSQERQVSEQEVTRTGQIASVRIHVQRAIRRLKVFKILKETVPVSMVKKIDKILRVCAALLNLGDDDLILEKPAVEDQPDEEDQAGGEDQTGGVDQAEGEQ